MPSLKRTKVIILLATYNPNLVFFKKQIFSIRSQTFQDFTCLILDDSTNDSESIRRIASEDSRFQYIKNSNRLGVFHNFEEGLYLTLGKCDYIAFCDQDDIWYPHKIETLLNGFRNASTLMVHSDLELINENDQVIHKSVWSLEKRHISHRYLSSILLRNPVTGCSCMIKESLAQLSLPFPPQGPSPFFHHDAWLAIVASYYGHITPIQQALIQYRSHSNNVYGPQAYSLLKRAKNLIHFQYIQNRFNTFNNLKILLNQHIQGKRNNPLFAPTKASQIIINDVLRIQKLNLSEKAYLLYWICIFFILNIKDKINFYILKKIIKPLFFKTLHQINLYVFFKKIYFQLISKKSTMQTTSTSTTASNTTQLGAPKTSATFHFLFPIIRRESIFGGVITGIKLALTLAHKGYSIIFYSHAGPIPPAELEGVLLALKHMLDPYSHLIQFKAWPTDNDWEEKDVFIASAWSTAEEILKINLKKCNNNQTHYYLVQDFEPGFYAWSDEFIRARNTYLDNHLVPLFNSDFLAQYFKNNNYFLNSEYITFKPQIDTTTYFPASNAKQIFKHKNCKTKVLIYGRPNTPRNLYPMIIRSLKLWSKQTKLTSQDVLFYSAGESTGIIYLSNDFEIHSLGKVTLEIYPSLLRNFDISICLMASPHPSYPPLESASCGMICITNNFENKTMESFSKNIVTMNTITDEELVQNLNKALELATQSEQRTKHSDLHFTEKYELTDLAQIIESRLK